MVGDQVAALGAHLDAEKLGKRQRSCPGALCRQDSRVSAAREVVIGTLDVSKRKCAHKQKRGEKSGRLLMFTMMYSKLEGEEWSMGWEMEKLQC